MEEPEPAKKTGLKKVRFSDEVGVAAVQYGLGPADLSTAGATGKKIQSDPVATGEFNPGELDASEGEIFVKSRGKRFTLEERKELETNDPELKSYLLFPVDHLKLRVDALNAEPEMVCNQFFSLAKVTVREAEKTTSEGVADQGIGDMFNLFSPEPRSLTLQYKPGNLIQAILRRNNDQGEPQDEGKQVVDLTQDSPITRAAAERLLVESQYPVYFARNKKDIRALSRNSDDLGIIVKTSDLFALIDEKLRKKYGVLISSEVAQKDDNARIVFEALQKHSEAPSPEGSYFLITKDRDQRDRWEVASYQEAGKPPTITQKVLLPYKAELSAQRLLSRKNEESHAEAIPQAKEEEARQLDAGTIELNNQLSLARENTAKNIGPAEIPKDLDVMRTQWDRARKQEAKGNLHGAIDILREPVDSELFFNEAKEEWVLAVCCLAKLQWKAMRSSKVTVHAEDATDENATEDNDRKNERIVFDALQEQLKSDPVPKSYTLQKQGEIVCCVPASGAAIDLQGPAASAAAEELYEEQYQKFSTDCAKT